MTLRGYTAGIVTITENLLKRKWSVIILRHFSNGLTDRDTILRTEKELTPVAMNERLRTMQRYGLIVRHPPRASAKAIDYRLTERGEKILRLLTLIEQLDDLPSVNDIVLKRPQPETPTGGRTPRSPALPKRKRPAASPAEDSPVGMPFVSP